MLVLRDGQTQFFGLRDDVLKALSEAAAKARAAQLQARRGPYEWTVKRE
jgi:ABC-type protease/lipase transport system fused ATPase/permease subunit